MKILFVLKFESVLNKTIVNNGGKKNSSETVIAKENLDKAFEFVQGENGQEQTVRFSKNVMNI